MCFGYGMYGHRKDTCPMERGDSTVAPEKLEENSVDGILAIQVNNQIRKEEIKINPEILENYGPWMLASRRPRRHQSKPNAQGLEETLHEKGNQNEPHRRNISFTKLKDSSSRYAALVTKNDEEMEQGQEVDLSACHIQESHLLKPISRNKGKRPNVQTQGKNQAPHTQAPPSNTSLWRRRKVPC